jgi:hypothetical protein
LSGCKNLVSKLNTYIEEEDEEDEEGEEGED